MSERGPIVGQNHTFFKIKTKCVAFCNSIDVEIDNLPFTLTLNFIDALVLDVADDPIDFGVKSSKVKVTLTLYAKLVTNQ